MRAANESDTWILRADPPRTERKRCGCAGKRRNGDERCFLEAAMIDPCPDRGEHHLSNAESEALDRLVDNKHNKTVLAVHAVYEGGAEALFPFLGVMAQLAFPFAEREQAAGRATGRRVLYEPPGVVVGVRSRD
jgi:hypothetical protein